MAIEWYIYGCQCREMPGRKWWWPNLDKLHTQCDPGWCCSQSQSKNTSWSHCECYCTKKVFNWNWVSLEELKKQKRVHATHNEVLTTKEVVQHLQLEAEERKGKHGKKARGHQQKLWSWHLCKILELLMMMRKSLKMRMTLVVWFATDCGATTYKGNKNEKWVICNSVTITAVPNASHMAVQIAQIWKWNQNIWQKETFNQNQISQEQKIIKGYCK